jgi:hypothetical protein
LKIRTPAPVCSKGMCEWPNTQCHVVQGDLVCGDGGAGSRGCFTDSDGEGWHAEGPMSLRVGGQFHGLAGVGRKEKG